jgi:hypothetical protein
MFEHTRYSWTQTWENRNKSPNGWRVAPVKNQIENIQNSLRH